MIKVGLVKVAVCPGQRTRKTFNGLEKEHLEKDIFIIGGPDIIVQTFDLFKEFYLTRIYGNFKCDKFININKIANTMNLIEKIDCDDTCHFEIWRK